MQQELIIDVFLVLCCVAAFLFGYSGNRYARALWEGVKIIAAIPIVLIGAVVTAIARRVRSC